MHLSILIKSTLVAGSFAALCTLAVADEFLVESETIAFGSPTCRTFSGYAVEAADGNCFSKEYFPGSSVSYWATCHVSGEVLPHSEENWFQPLRVSGLTWNQTGAGGYWDFDGIKIASCRDIYSQPELSPGIYFDVENEVSDGALRVKAKLYQRTL